MLALRAQAGAQLRNGETLRALLPALTPRPDGGGRGLVPAAVLVLPINAVQRWRWRRASRANAKQSIFPLAPRMFVGLTEGRLLIWARRGSKLGPFLGFVSLDRIVDAAAPTVGQGWRTVTVHLANEPTVSLRVPGSVADDFAAALAGRGATNDPAS
jgi:hypothetical protein